jgi:elongator complex protein 2
VEHASLSDSSRALKANLPELGLSNKALRDGESSNTLRGMHMVSESVHASSSADRSARVPPPEDYLLTHTLWPEIEKLYGHGFELLSVACSYDGSLVASACVAKKSQHAVVRVWETREWSELLQLEAHRSSVVQLAFAPDNRFLLGVSRDRHVSLFRLQAPFTAAMGKSVFLGCYKVRAHARIIWSCSWVPLRGMHVFATGSRDKTAKVFRVDEQGRPVEEAVLPVFNSAVTAVAFAPLLPQPAGSSELFASVEDLTAAGTPRPLTLAVGLEDGSIELWQSTTPLGAASAPAAAAAAEGVSVKPQQWVRLHAFHSNVCHSGRIKRLCWRWRSEGTASTSESASELELASCGEDHSVRIFSMEPAFLYPQGQRQ